MLILNGGELKTRLSIIKGELVPIFYPASKRYITSRKPNLRTYFRVLNVLLYLILCVYSYIAGIYIFS